jgi:hypothetical protein
MLIYHVDCVLVKYSNFAVNTFVFEVIRDAVIMETSHMPGFDSIKMHYILHA